MLRGMVFVRIVFLCAGLLFAAISPSRAEYVGANQASSNIHLQLELNAINNLAKITMSGPENGWFSIGFGGVAMDGYAIVIGAQNSGNYFETYMQYAMQPTPLANQSLTLVSTGVVGNTRTMVFERSLVGATGQHYTFTPAEQTITLEWAYGDRPFNQHTDRGYSSIQLVSVPEPGSAMLLLSGVAFAASRRRRGLA